MAGQIWTEDILKNMYRTAEYYFKGCRAERSGIDRCR